MKNCISKKLKLLIVFLVLFLNFYYFSSLIFAQVPPEMRYDSYDDKKPKGNIINAMKDNINLSGINVTTADEQALTGMILKYMFGLLAVLFFLLIIYGGITWMTAAGNETRVEKAKNIIIASVIGITIVLTAYLITAIVITLLTPA